MKKSKSFFYVLLLIFLSACPEEKVVIQKVYQDSDHEVIQKANKADDLDKKQKETQKMVEKLLEKNDDPIMEEKLKIILDCMHHSCSQDLDDLLRRVSQLPCQKKGSPQLSPSPTKTGINKDSPSSSSWVQTDDDEDLTSPPLDKKNNEQ